MISLKDCQLCPRRCGVDRTQRAGFCGAGAKARIALVSLHKWEEPCLTGPDGRGAGTVFFSYCNLRCCFCQNHEISHEGFGYEVTDERLAAIFLEQQARGAATLDLVTPTHYVPEILHALEMAREQGFHLPVVYNSGAYETEETIEAMRGQVDIFLPDLKYALSEPAARYSAAADYPQVARAAVLEMYRQTGPFRLDEDGLLQRGVLIRHLILPRQAENTRRVIDWVGETFAPGQVLFSLMSQYTPVGDLARWPELQHPISPELNEEMYQYLIDSPIADGFYQDLDAATGDMIPAFDGTGV